MITGAAAQSVDLLAQATVPTPPSTSHSIGPGPSLGNGGSASGLSSQPGSNTSGGQNAIPNTSLPISGPPPSFGLFPGVGNTLLSSGIDIHGFAIDHFVSNTTAGVVRGTDSNLGIIAPAVDFDLGKIAGITGGNVHLQLSIFGISHDTPNGIAQFGGFLTGYQATPALKDNPIYLSTLTYEQKLLNDKLSIEVGRTNPFDAFTLPNSLDFFTYSSVILAVDADIPAAPFPVWGGRATYHFTPGWYVQGGVYDDYYYRATHEPEVLGTNGSPGVNILGEIAYRTEFFNAAYPTNFELGGEWDARGGYSDVKGSPFVASPFTTAANYPGGGAIFVQGAKVVWRGASIPFGPPPNIQLYGSAAAAVDKPQPFDMDASLGATLTGLIPRRPFDALGIAAHYQRMSAVEANFETELHNIFAGPGPKQSRNGFAFELNGNIQLTKWFAVRPLVEYFVNPDNYFDAAQNHRASDGFVAGLIAYIPLGPVLGTSTKPF